MLIFRGVSCFMSGSTVYNIHPSSPEVLRLLTRHEEVPGDPQQFIDSGNFAQNKTPTVFFVHFFLSKTSATIWDAVLSKHVLFKGNSPYSTFYTLSGIHQYTLWIRFDPFGWSKHLPPLEKTSKSCFKGRCISTWRRLTAQYGIYNKDASKQYQNVSNNTNIVFSKAPLVCLKHRTRLELPITCLLSAWEGYSKYVLEDILLNHSGLTSTRNISNNIWTNTHTHVHGAHKYQ